MPDTLTIEIEHALGEDIEIEVLRDLLKEENLKIKSWGEGRRMLTNTALKQAAEQLDHAREMVGYCLGEKDGD